MWIPGENLNSKQIRIYENDRENGKTELLKSARLRVDREAGERTVPEAPCPCDFGGQRPPCFRGFTEIIKGIPNLLPKFP